MPEPRRDYAGILANQTQIRTGALARCQQRVAAVNAKPDKPIRKTGVPKDGSGGTTSLGNEIMSCRGGGGMAVRIKDKSVFVKFSPALLPSATTC